MSAEDVAAQRRAIADCWEQAAEGWGRQQAVWGEQSAPVTRWMIDAAELAPGMRVLDLAAGTGEVGFTALPRILPGGTLICSDQSEAMVEVARSRAQAAGVEDVEFRVLDGEWIDLELASVDAVLCRWGYMLMADPPAALRETRRVLRPGERDAPGPFSISDPVVVRSMLEDAGFGAVRTDAIDVARRAPDFDSWWATHLDLSVATRTAIATADTEQTQAVEAEIARRFAAYTAADGSLAVPGRTLVAVAEA